MHDNYSSHKNEEINMVELFAMFWAYKFLIAFVCILSISLGVNYLLSAEKEFTSKAIFEYEDNSGQYNGAGLSPEIGALAGLASLGLNVKSKTVLPIDEIMGREFIEAMDKSIDFRGDPYFNTYNPDAKNPAWKANIKSLIGWSSTKPDSNEAMWQGIVNVYKDSVELSLTEEGANEVSASHKDAVRSAEIANTIMMMIIKNSKDKSDKAQDAQLNYLANTLASALEDLEEAQSKLKNFTLSNSTIPLEEFAAVSMKLDLLRDEYSRASLLHDALSKISKLLIKGTTKEEDYKSLREKFPIVDQVEFRRVMGQNEIISSWTWPDLVSVNSVFDTLSERKKRLEAEIVTVQFDAERAGRELEEYGGLVREAKIAEATYTVLIEQVKAQSMLAGFRPDNYTIYEYAAPSLSPSAPVSILILAISAFLGIIVGSTLAFAISSFHGVFYARRTLILEAQAHINVRAQTLMYLRGNTLSKLNKRMPDRPRKALRDFAVKIHQHESNLVALTSFNAKLKAVNLAMALATFMQTDNLRIGIINFSENNEEPNGDFILVGNFMIIKEVDKVAVLKPKSHIQNIEFLGQKDFEASLNLLQPEFDLVFLCADDADALSMAGALAGRDLAHITIARLKKTKLQALAHARMLLPIEGLIHE